MPTQSSETFLTENLQKSYTKKIPEVRNLNYWQRLVQLRMYFQQRGLERHRILYTWKILEQLAPNCGLESSTSDRRGRQVKVPQLKGPLAIKSLREQSFQVNGPKLFNCLPSSIRNLSGITVDEFKFKLDQFLSRIPDEPSVEGLTPSACDLYSAAPSNSIIDQSRIIKIRRPGV